MVTLLLGLAIYYFFANVSYLVLLWFSRQLVQKRSTEVLSIVSSWPKVSVIMSAYNEEEVILKSTASILQNQYPSLELIVVNDGSCDQTLNLLIHKYQLRKTTDRDELAIYISSKWPNLKVIDKLNTGKAKSLNTALEFVQSKYVVTLDADTFVEQDAFHQAIQLIESRPDCMAVGGTIRILNGADLDATGVHKGRLPKDSLSMLQVVEYIRAFFGGRLGWEELGGTALLSGAFSMFRTEELKAIGGWDPNCITEDFEVVIRMKHYYTLLNRKCEIHMFPNPACWTIVPKTLRLLFWQRVRWQKGLVRALRKHKALIFNPKFGRMGLLTLPYMLIFEALSPIVELIGYIIILVGIYQGIVPFEYITVGAVFGISLYVLITLTAIHIEEKHYARNDTKKPRLRFILYCILENLGYRQFLFAARLYGTFAALRSKHKWGVQKCTPLEEKKAA